MIRAGKRIALAVTVALAISSMIIPSHAAARAPDYESIADKIVNHSLQVKPGEAVVITGNPGQDELLKALVVATTKAGGDATVEISYPDANKKAMMETSLEYLSLPRTYSIMQMRAADCFINVGSVQDPTLFADVPEERFAAWRQGSALSSAASRNARFRSVGLGQVGGIPTKAYAKSRGADHEEMLSMFWKGVDVDYRALAGTAGNAQAFLAPGSKISLKSSHGTDLTFRLDKTEARVNTGTATEYPDAGPAQCWLPAGEVYTCIQPTSASGTLVVPHLKFRGMDITNLVMDFSNGRMTRLQADQNGKALEDYFAQTDGDDDVLSLVDIGLNPNCLPMASSNYLSWEMSGMISLGVGDNSWAGGDVESDGGMYFHLANASLSVDGVELVAKGDLKMDKLTAR